MLSIIYRAYPLISKRTAIQFKTKAEMLRFCLTSLSASLCDTEFECVFVSDNCSNDQKAIVEDLLKGRANNFRTVELGGQGNQRSFAAQLDQVASCKYEHVLLLEDDYYVGAKDIQLNIMALNEGLGDYTTFYYPPDAECTVGGMNRGVIHSSESPGLQATVLPSTTLTFFGRKDTLLEDMKYFHSFVAGAHDSSLWLRLTGNFFWFLTRLRFRQFYNMPKLYLSIIKRYVEFMLPLPVGRRRLIFVGTGLSVHLDSGGAFNRFSQLHLLEELKLSGGGRSQ